MKADKISFVYRNTPYKLNNSNLYKYSKNYNNTDLDTEEDLKETVDLEKNVDLKETVDLKEPVDLKETVDLEKNVDKMYRTPSSWVDELFMCLMWIFSF